MLIVANNHHLDDCIEISLFPVCYISTLDRLALEYRVCGDFGIRFSDLLSWLFCLLALCLELGWSFFNF